MYSSYSSYLSTLLLSFAAAAAFQFELHWSRTSGKWCTRGGSQTKDPAVAVGTCRVKPTASSLFSNTKADAHRSRTVNAHVRSQPWPRSISPPSAHTGKITNGGNRPTITAALARMLAPLSLGWRHGSSNLCVYSFERIHYCTRSGAYLFFFYTKAPGNLYLVPVALASSFVPGLRL